MPNAKMFTMVMDFLAQSMLRKVLEGEKALFAREQYKVLLGVKAALINYALF